MSDTKVNPPVIHVKVKVTETTDPSNGARKFSAKYHPEVITVTDPDTILTFKISDKTKSDIIITNVQVRQKDNDQLSTPSISKNRKQVVLSDVNTAGGTFNLDFDFGTSTTNARSSAEDCDPTPSEDYPEIINEPPP